MIGLKTGLNYLFLLVHQTTGLNYLFLLVHQTTYYIIFPLIDILVNRLY